MAIEAQHLLMLLNWMSPAFPIGGFAYSHGLEWAIDNGDIKTADDVERWISDVITQGSGWNDAVVFASVWRQNPQAMNELALALCSSRERYLETTQLGAAFKIAAQVFSDHTVFEGDLAYPVAAAMGCRAMGIECEAALLAFLQGFSNALISVAVRLVPLGQTAGLKIMLHLMPVVATTAERASAASIDDLGSCTVFSDMAAIRHETQYSRVFRT